MGTTLSSAELFGEQSGTISTKDLFGDNPVSNVPPFDIALKPNEEPNKVARDIVSGTRTVSSSGTVSSKDLFGSTEPIIPGAGIVHTARAMAETGAGLATGMIAFPVSQLRGLWEYAITLGDKKAAIAAEEAWARALQFEPATQEAQGAMRTVGIAIDPIFKTLKQMGESSPAGYPGGVVAQLGGAYALGRAGKIVKGEAGGVVSGAQESFRSMEEALKFGEEAKPNVIPAESIKLDKPTVFTTPEKPVTEVPPVETGKVPSPPEFVQPGATSGGKESRLAVRAEADAIEAKLTEDFGPLVNAGKKMSMEEEYSKIKDISDNDYNRSKRIAMGRELPPEGTRVAAFYETVKKRAIAEGDAETIRQLATESTVPTLLTEYGREIKAADSRIIDDPVKVVQDVVKTRSELSTRTTKPQNIPQPEEIARLRTQVETIQKSLDDLMASKGVERIKNEVAKEQRQTKRVYAKQELSVEFNGLVKDLNSILGGQLNVGIDPMAAVILGKMAKNRVRAGVITIEGIVDEVYTAVKNIGIELDKRAIRDAISGYGITSTMSKEAINVQMRELKRQMRLVSALEDAQAGEVPLRSGLQRDLPSDRVRELTKQVQQAMRDSGIDIKSTKSPEEQWKTSIQAYKTRTANRITDLERKLSTGDFEKKPRKPMALDLEAQKLKTEYERVKETYNHAVEIAGTITKEEVARIVDMSKTMADTRTAMEQGGNRFVYGASRVAYENYVNSLKGEHNPLSKMVKERWSEAKTTWEQNKARATREVAKDSVQTISDNSVSLVASLDNSFLLRQGIKVLMTHPSQWFPAAIKSFSDIIKTLGGKNAHDALMADIYSRPNYLNGEYQKAKILTPTEEQYPTSLPERIPVLGRTFKASQYAFTGSAIRMRTGLYDLLSNMAKENGVDMSLKSEYESLGKMINSLTARGKWGERGEPPLVRILLWAPKMLKGNIDVFTVHWFGTGLESNFFRYQASKNLLKIIAETAVVITVANALKPGSAETNSTSSNFGKIKAGKTTFDYTGGAGSLLTLASRLIRNERKSSVTGKTIPFSSGFGKQSRFDAVIDFVVNKAAPPAREVINWLRGESFGGAKWTRGGALYRMTAPIMLQNVIQLKDNASADQVAGIIADGLGISANTNQPRIRGH